MKLFLLPAATLLMANGAYASVRGATTDIVDFIDNGSIQYQCNFANNQKRTCPKEDWTMQDDGSAEARGPFDCGTDGDTKLGCCTITAPKDVVDAFSDARTRRRQGEIMREIMTFDLPGHGTCNLAGPRDDIDFDELSTEEVEGMFESELSNGIELDEDELYPDFLQLEGKCGCRDNCPSGQFCDKSVKCNTKNTKNTGQCKNNKNNKNNNSNRNNNSSSCKNRSKNSCKSSNNCHYSNGNCKSGSNKSNKSSSCKNRSKNSCQDSNKCKYKDGKCKDRSVDDVLAELIAEEDEKAAELSNGIEFVEEENRSCSRTSQCRSGEFCNNSGHCQNRNNNRNYCRNQSDCRNRNENLYCDERRNECRRATGQSCQSGTDCGDGSGSVWMCRDGQCKPRSLFELAMERVMNGEGVVFDLDEAMEEE